MPIKTFSDKKLEKFFKTGDRKKIKDKNYPGSNFHKLKGTLKDFYSVHVNGNFVVIFRFKNGDAYNVKYLDYH